MVHESLSFPSHPTSPSELDEVSRAEEGNWLGPYLCSLEDINLYHWEGDAL